MHMVSAKSNAVRHYPPVLRVLLDLFVGKVLQYFGESPVPTRQGVRQVR
jgi:hypothetical protein